MSEQELIYLMALTRLLPYNSQVQHALLDAVGNATTLFEARRDLGSLIPDITPRLVETVAQMGDHIARAEQELNFAQNNHIAIIPRDDSRYPIRLRECQDAPVVLFYRGNADLNSLHFLSIVGTRKATDYGKRFCQRFLNELSQICPDCIIVSGLAYGIDIAAHRQALANGLQTIGVLAHGLDQIYPRMHRNTAIEMLTHGGLLTEFMSQSNADKINFVSRNRIVAGMADATLVVESARKGGSLITADIANGYSRDVFAVPGRIGDYTSEGCNQLISNNRAALLTSAEDFMEIIGWKIGGDKKHPIQRDLFVQLSAEKQSIYNALKDTDGKHINQLTVETNLPIGQISSLLFELEMRGLVRQLSGGLYRIV